MPAHAAPASEASTIVSTTCGTAGMPANEDPTHTATIVPTVYWPWPPMLKRPQRNANATERPVRMSGVTRSSVCCRFSAALHGSEHVFHGNSQLRPVPSKIAR